MDGLDRLFRKASTPRRPYRTLNQPYMSQSSCFHEYPKTCNFDVQHKVTPTYPLLDHFMWVWWSGDGKALNAVQCSESLFDVQCCVQSQICSVLHFALSPHVISPAFHGPQSMHTHIHITPDDHTHIKWSKRGYVRITLCWTSKL